MIRFFPYFLSLLITLSSFNGKAQHIETSSSKELNCLAINGLTLRNSPSVKGDKISVIPYGSKLTLLKHSGNIETIGGFHGEWVQVKFQEATGYVFDAYISGYPAPQLRKQGYSSCYNYLVKNFDITGGNKKFKIEKADMEVFNEDVDFGNITYNFNNQEHDGIETIIIKNADLEECFIVFTATTWVFRKYTLDPNKYVKTTDENGLSIYQYEDLINPENSDEQLSQQYLTYKVTEN